MITLMLQCNFNSWSSKIQPMRKMKEVCLKVVSDPHISLFWGWAAAVKIAKTSAFLKNNEKPSHCCQDG